MFDKKEKEDLDLLIEIGRKQGERLTTMTISNCFVGFPSEKQTDNIYNSMITYLESAGIEIVDDGSDIETEDEPSPVPEKKFIYIGHVGHKLPTVKYH